MVWIDPYVVPLVFLALVVGFAAWLIMDYFRVERARATDSYWSKETSVKRLGQLKKQYPWAMVGGILVAIIAANLLTWGISAWNGSTMSRTGNYQEAAAEFGLEDGRQYPLSIGGVYGGTQGSISYFSANAITDLRPATALNLSFSHEGRSWITTIPTDLITFHIDNDKPSSVSVNLKHYSYGIEATWDNQLESYNGLSNGMMGSVYQFAHEIRLSEAGQRDGLAPVVNRGVTHVDITLSEALYNQVFSLR